MSLKNRDFKNFPKFKHNLWYIDEEHPQITYLTVSSGSYEVPTEDAKEFLKIRPYCSGYNSVVDISNKCQVTIDEIHKIIDPMIEAELLHSPIEPLEAVHEDEILENFSIAATLFGEQLAQTNIGFEVFSGRLKKEIVIGWLFETYHYIKKFPCALQVAADHATGELKNVLLNYAKEEEGHEIFILKCLEIAGYSKDEIEESIPLVSTRTINLLLKELFADEPSMALVVASMIEACEYDKDVLKDAGQAINKYYDLPSNMLDSFFYHIQIDNELGHQKLLERNSFFLRKIKKSKLNELMNKLHDLKHAFDLQNLEIKYHYGKIGSYLPRQKIYFSSI